MKRLWVQTPAPGHEHLTLGSLRRMVEMLDAVGADENTMILTPSRWLGRNMPVTELTACGLLRLEVAPPRHTEEAGQ